MMRNLFRAAVYSPDVHIGNVEANCREIEKLYKENVYQADLIVTPELSMTGYTCGDLFANRLLIDQSRKYLKKLADMTAAYGEAGAALVVGLPFEKDSELLNCAALLHNGKVAAIVPKMYIPNYGEFYEKRWFSAGEFDPEQISWYEGESTWFGNRLIVELGTFGESVKIGMEVCEDGWAPVSPGRLLAVNGAEIILNLSASNEVIGKEQYRRTLMGSTSSSCLCGYIYVSAGRMESTSDLVFGGHNLMYENGKLLGETKPFRQEVLIRDFSLTKIRHDRIANKSFADCKKNLGSVKYQVVTCSKRWIKKEEFCGKLSITPFVPSSNRRQRCMEIFQMQVAGLQRRIEVTHSRHVVVGVSGGLDSTLALLVASQAAKKAGMPSDTVIGITMPGFGTTSRTKNNSLEMMKVLGCDCRTISISDSVRQHFKDIGHDEEIKDATYENSQARERTQILMDVSNQVGGFVVGTGDLSELALGWCTYNGDHMSMYAVNTSIPKTLVRTLVDEIGHYLSENGYPALAAVIEDVIDTPVSPELLPPNEDGSIAQITEDTIGSYVLHDFFLYYTLRFGMQPDEIYELCRCAVRQSEEYKFNDEEIRKWQKVFYTRFFRQQFKRNCMPDGVKVGTVSVSPRGDLRLPSEVDFGQFVGE